MPRDEYLDLLRGMTNVRVIKDPDSETGYKFVQDDNFKWKLPPVPGF